MRSDPNSDCHCILVDSHLILLDTREVLAIYSTPSISGAAPSELKPIEQRVAEVAPEVGESKVGATWSMGFAKSSPLGKDSIAPI
jgi:hypothetical protein